MPSRYRTLGDLRGELLARIGMGGMGASGGANGALMNSFLRNSQWQLYNMADWKHLEEFVEVTTGVGQNLYDYPKACARDQRIIRIETVIAGQVVELKEGITPAMWGTMDVRSQPARFERLAQILVYPRASAAYTMRIWYIKDLGRFTQDGDPATLDDELILLHSIVAAKGHYRHPDAKFYEGQLDIQLARLRGRSFGSNGVYRRSDGAIPIPKPVVVGRDDLP